eukprot:3463182-Prorocentrum_lima.AAC.1
MVGRRNSAGVIALESRTQVGCVQHPKCFCTHMQCPGMLERTMAHGGSATAGRGRDTVHAQ